MEIQRHDDLEARNQAIFDDAEAGITRREIAERNHVSIQTVNAVLGAMYMEQRRNEADMPVVEFADEATDGGLEISVSDETPKPKTRRQSSKGKRSRTQVRGRRNDTSMYMS